MSQKRASNNAGGELPYRSILNTFEKLPFAKANGGIWRARNFFFECDVINGGGVWVEWRKDEKFRGMGFIQQAYDQPTAAQDLVDFQVKPGKRAQYTCAKRRLSVVAGTKCKALQLLYATPRSKKKTATGAALLKLYPKTAASAAADYLTGLYDNMKEECNDHEALSKFRALLTQAAADRRNKPDSPAAARKSSAKEPPLLQGSF